MAVYTPDQDGNGRIGVSWNEFTTLQVSRGALIVSIGMRYQLHTEFDSESRPIEPALVWPSFDLTLYLAEAQLNTGTFHLGIVPEAAPEAYSVALSPNDRDEVALLDTSGDASSVTITIGAALGTAVTFSNVAISTTMTRLLRHSSYNGYFCLTITCDDGDRAIFHSSSATNSAYYPTLTTTEVAFTTGMWDGDSIDRRSRMRHCPRTGMPVASDAMIRDGWTEGLMVSEEGWEPEDPEDRYVPNPHEGVVDDEV